jgi:hypothetical protein
VHQSVHDFWQREFHYHGAIINSTPAEYMDKISAEKMSDCDPLGCCHCPVKNVHNLFKSANRATLPAVIHKQGVFAHLNLFIFRDNPYSCVLLVLAAFAYARSEKRENHVAPKFTLKNENKPSQKSYRLHKQILDLAPETAVRVRPAGGLFPR